MDLKKVLCLILCVCDSCQAAILGFNICTYFEIKWYAHEETTRCTLKMLFDPNLLAQFQPCVRYRLFKFQGFEQHQLLSGILRSVFEDQFILVIAPDNNRKHTKMQKIPTPT